MLGKSNWSPATYVPTASAVSAKERLSRPRVPPTHVHGGKSGRLLQGCTATLVLLHEDAGIDVTRQLEGSFHSSHHDERDNRATNYHLQGHDFTAGAR